MSGMYGRAGATPAADSDVQPCVHLAACCSAKACPVTLNEERLFAVAVSPDPRVLPYTPEVADQAKALVEDPDRGAWPICVRVPVASSTNRRYYSVWVGGPKRESAGRLIVTITFASDTSMIAHTLCECGRGGRDCCHAWLAAALFVAEGPMDVESAAEATDPTRVAPNAARPFSFYSGFVDSTLDYMTEQGLPSSIPETALEAQDMAEEWFRSTKDVEVTLGPTHESCPRCHGPLEHKLKKEKATVIFLARKKVVTLTGAAVLELHARLPVPPPLSLLPVLLSPSSGSSPPGPWLPADHDALQNSDPLPLSFLASRVC